MLGFKWIVPGELAGSPQPGLYGDWDDDVSFLRNGGINYIMSLTEEPLIQHQAEAAGFGFIHFPIRDMDIPMPRDASAAIIKLVKEIESGHTFLIHCKGGVGRTGMMGACYMVSKGISANEAIEKVRAIHPPYIQTKNQEAFVTHFQQFYHQELKI
ncbi:MAG: dual specificity protein phosphatase family protein [Cyclobacteriaceae bacterium]|nr:dual specificity protein phosphatase family protein [Cyclobacteriaceae bacterium HetDA_MAG_MS6]